ncbi:MAG: ribosomal protein S18-alanine N-acetyltransferase [Ruminococcus sp.]|uniref:ribosomal protein S18-alanine N-acetyltransferase n=1 Tax=Ruminococcus sp. TaxID=41978 RepID=UPI001B22A25E|nr:ribosomal protein S18-alanine N-acetyltransferase [Ruminococcus sp.]MBO7473723.1 ribosomal protein S18-alanine N-acetyltransferase [Ruminococcus sp.]
MNNSQFSILNSQLSYEDLSNLDKLCIGVDGWSAEDFRSEAEKDGGIVLAAYCGEELAGLIAGFTAADTGEILTVATAPKYRRQGAAKILMEAFLDAVPDGVETIALEVRQSNTPAIALYECFGFEMAGVRKRFYREPVEDANVMVLNRRGAQCAPVNA